jgi:hypothetical protein
MSTPFLSVVYVTDRPAVVEVDGTAVAQFDLLFDSLVRSSFADWELVVVTPRQIEAARALALFGHGGRLRVVPPPDTPWRRAGAFCAASARNAGLVVAAGEWVLGLDDFVAFDVDLLERVASYARAGVGLVPLYEPPGASPRGGSAPVVQDVAGGVLTYRRADALAAGGHDERFDGAGVDGRAAYEDLEFSVRLVARGARFVADPRAQVFLHPHPPTERRLFRCARLVWHLLRRSLVANRPWSAVELFWLTGPCCRARTFDDRCGLADGAACAGPLGRETASKIVAEWETRPWVDVGRGWRRTPSVLLEG